MKRTIPLFFLLVVCSSFAFADESSIQPGPANGTDAWMHSTNKDTNYGSLFYSAMAGTHYMAFNFNFTCKTFSSGTTIESVTIEFTNYEPNAITSVSAYPFLDWWEELVLTYNNAPPVDESYNLVINISGSYTGGDNAKWNMTMNATWFQAQCQNVWDDVTNGSNGFRLGGTTSGNANIDTSDGGVAGGRPKIYFTFSTFVDSDPPLLSNAILQSDEGGNTTYDSTPTINITATDDTGTAGVCLSNSSIGTYANCVTRGGECSLGTINWVCTPPVNQSLTSYTDFTSLYAWAIDDLSNAHTVYNLSIDVKLLPADSCTYISGDWDIDCSDNCEVNLTTNIGGNNLNFDGTGQVAIEADIDDIKNITVQEGCKIDIGEGNFTIIEN